MLGKLMKHEWKATWRIPTLIMAVLLITTILSSFVFYLPFWKNESEDLPILGFMVFLLYYVVLIGSSLAITFSMFARFYKSMFTDEGYLTHTLPVSPRQLLISKGIIMGIWYLISSFGILLSIFLFINNAIIILQPEGMSVTQFWNNVAGELQFPSGSVYVHFFLSLIVFMAASFIANIGITIGSVCFGQLVARHKIMGTISAYLVIYFAVEILASLILIPAILSSITGMESEINVASMLAPIYYLMAVIMVITGVVLLFLSERILKKKINLD